ncbi:pyrimidine dimer DNA glycosylase/endonuclease V [Leucobacter allii]|uniref:Pyrimidine dimer DNA glycosylase/endonuclease V n=1 Tax=Leucobacter allii TaxID=2932247 RepID=A0ABY4FNQ0_9MICO|nr:pyrimidine dimer DNA glycosylase/endonuclease V [Leucobacter allii]UOQ57903.1 pyrimidine dimer DNA glycosylase/endonuclease V [Leucobacter allii]UOR02536.1 pyrimidine dimer DNA glycosylase/endonuclease V [Leucobacter allii]
MRIWSLHPGHLDRAGLVACWRETLLAQAVLAGRTRGYRSHPQLHRFREAADPLAAITAYLHGVADEADRRGYRFDRSRVDLPAPAPEHAPRLAVTDGQLALEWRHLGAKLAARSPEDAARWHGTEPTPHPLFVVEPGPVAPWERA